MILCKDAEFGKQFNKAVFPGIQGGPLMHVIAAKAVALGEALRLSSRSTQRRPSRTPRRSLRRCSRMASASSRAARTTT